MPKPENAAPPRRYDDVREGQVWERRNGTRFEIDAVEPQMGRVRYWLARGSKPQFKYIDIDNLLKRYRLVSDASAHRDFHAASRRFEMMVHDGEMQEFPRP